MSDFLINPFSVMPSSVSWFRNFLTFKDTSTVITDASPPNKIAVDSSGNTYFLGYYSGAGGTSELNGTIIESDTVPFAVLNKWGTSGTNVWTLKAYRSTPDGVGGGSVTFQDLAIDSSGNIWVVGNYRGACIISFGALSLPVGSGTGEDWFIAKASSAGQWLSVERFNTSVTTAVADTATRIRIDSNDNLIISGAFMGTLTLGSFSVSGSTTIQQAFIAKRTNAGTWSWLKGITPSSVANIVDFDLDSSNNIYVVGDYITGGFTVDGVTFPAPTGNSDSFLIKFNSSGTAQWGARIGSTSGDSVKGVAVVTDSKIIVAGHNPAVTVDTTVTSANSTTNNIPRSTVGRQGFLIYFNASGIYQNSSRLVSSGGINDTRYMCVFKLGAGRYGVGGMFGSNSTITLGNSITGNNAINGTDGFYAVFNASDVAQFCVKTGISTYDGSPTTERFEWTHSGLLFGSDHFITISVSRVRSGYVATVNFGNQQISASTVYAGHNILITKQKIDGTWEI